MTNKINQQGRTAKAPRSLEDLMNRAAVRQQEEINQKRDEKRALIAIELKKLAAKERDLVQALRCLGLSEEPKQLLKRLCGEDRALYAELEHLALEHDEEAGDSG